VAFLSVYLDESYGDGKPNFLVGGFVSGIDRWAQFANRWKVELQDEFEIPYLHMKELMDKRSRIYRHLSEPRKVQLFEIALTIIRDHADFGIVCRINPEEHVTITTPDERIFHGSAYTVAVYGCIQGIKVHLGEKVAGTTLNIFLEDGHRNANQALGNLLETWRAQQGIDPSSLSSDAMWINQESFELQKRTELQYGTIALGTKTQMMPLQAADLLAYGVLNISGVPDPQEPDLRKVVFTEALNVIGSRAPIFVYDLSPEKIREGLDTHRKKLEMETEIRHQIARTVGTVGGKVLRQGRGFKVHFDNPSEETRQALVKALLSPIDAKRKEDK
jgi:hypothetical protein